MTGSESQRATGSDLEDATSEAAGAEAAQGSAPAGSAAEGVRSPPPLTSLDSLFGGTFASGSVCAADGTCA